MSRLKSTYLEKIRPEWQKEDNINIYAVPRIEKVIVSSGIGKMRVNEKYVETVKNNMALITGQKPVIRKAKKAISGFKVRENDPVGIMVTLRNEKMYDFLDKLANITLPRLRDFRGLSPQSFDRQGNFNLGFKEHLVFPEISHEGEIVHGLEITIVTSTRDLGKAQKLLENLGFPFSKNISKEPNNG